MSAQPVLVLAAHGTIHPDGPRVFEDLADRVRHRAPAAEVRVAFVDVIGPTLEDTLAAVCRGGGEAVVVPVFLGSGYHVEIDIPRVVAAHGDQVTVARALGPAPEVVDAVADLFRAACMSGGAVTGCEWGDESPLPDRVILAAAGSTNEGSRRQARTAADHLAASLGRPVDIGFLTAGTPKVHDAVQEARRAGSTVGVATYLLGPGTFHDRLGSVGADVVAEPIGPHRLLADLITSRYREALGTSSGALWAAPRLWRGEGGLRRQTS